jgi:hypothetical protein
MVIDPRFVYLAILLAFGGQINYLLATWRGTTQPHRVTWALWGTASLMAFGVEVQQHVGPASYMTLAFGVLPCLVLLASFRSSQASWAIDRIDMVCGAASIVGLVLWALTNESTVALVFFATADFLAALPTYRKSWRAPESESASAFVFGSLNCTITLLTLRHFTTGGALYPGVILTTDALLSIMILGRVGPRLARRSVVVA